METNLLNVIEFEKFKWNYIINANTYIQTTNKYCLYEYIRLHTYIEWSKMDWLNICTIK